MPVKAPEAQRSQWRRCAPRGDDFKQYKQLGNFPKLVHAWQFIRGLPQHGACAIVVQFISESTNMHFIGALLVNRTKIMHICSASAPRAAPQLARPP